MKLIILPLFVALSAFAKEQQFTVRWSINHQPVSYFDQVSKEFKKTIEARSHGRLKLAIEVENIKEESMLPLIQKNEIQMGHAYTHELEALNAEFGIFQLPFLFDSDHHLTLFSQSPEGKRLFASLDAKEIHAVDYTYSGGQIGVYGPKIKSFTDLKGIKFNTENGSESYIAALKNTGIKTENLKSDLPTFDGLKSHQITSGEAIPWVMWKVLETPEMKDVYFNRTRHRIVTRVLIFSNKFLQTLPADLKTILLEEADKLCKNERAIAIEDIQTVSSKFAKETKYFNDWSAAQRAEGKKLFAPYYKAFISKHTSRLVDAVEGLNPEKKSLASNQK